MYDPKKPYNQLALLPPDISLTKEIFNKTVSANKALAELKGLAGLIPNQAIILNSLILKEAKDSSEIENIVTTHDELYKAISTDGNGVAPAVKEVLSYREALWAGFEVLKKKKLITVRDMVDIQEILIANKAGIRALPGTALKNAKTEEVIYTPPSGKEIIEDKLKNLEQFINTDDVDIDPLIKMAIMHYQFESIHPFYDGNGRTGRILNVLYLIHQELLEMPILYISSYIIKHKRQYYEGLDQVRSRENWEGWISYMLDAVEYTSKDTIKTIKGIRFLLEQAIETVKTELPKIYSKELVESLFNQPYCRISTLETNLNVTRFTASKYLKELEGIGLLKGERIGRDVIYINKPLFDLLKKDTLDDKLSMLEKDLDAIDPGETIQDEFNEVVFFKIFDSWLVDLMRKLILVGQKYNRLFRENNHHAFVINGIGMVKFTNEDVEDIIRNLRTDCEQNREKIRGRAEFQLSFSYHKLEKGGLKMFAIGHHVRIDFEDIKYKVLMDEFADNTVRSRVIQFEERLLHKPVTKQEINDLAMKMDNILFKEIDYYTKKLGIR
jgi:Fic family protein